MLGWGSKLGKQEDQRKPWQLESPSKSHQRTQSTRTDPVAFSVVPASLESLPPQPLKTGYHQPDHQPRPSILCFSYELNPGRVPGWPDPGLCPCPFCKGCWESIPLAWLPREGRSSTSHQDSHTVRRFSDRARSFRGQTAPENDKSGKCFARDYPDRLPGTPDLLYLLAVPGVDCYGVAASAGALT